MMASEQQKVINKAASQIGYKEGKNSNNKYGKWFGANYQPWCAIFVCWVFNMVGLGNLVTHNSNAAYLQDDIVNKRGGKWVMKKAYNNKTKKNNLKNFKKGDIVTFDFGSCDGYRRHIGIIESVSGTNLITIEGNTSKSGSQSNGGFVERKTRSYTLICAVARPAYTTSDKLKPLKVDGKFGYNTKTRLQRWLGVIEDGLIGVNTIKALQKKVGATADGSWGKKTTKALQRYLNANGANPKLAVDGSFGKKTIKALQEMLNREVTK